MKYFTVVFGVSQLWLSSVWRFGSQLRWGEEGGDRREGVSWVSSDPQRMRQIWWLPGGAGWLSSRGSGDENSFKCWLGLASFPFKSVVWTSVSALLRQQHFCEIQFIISRRTVQMCSIQTYSGVPWGKMLLFLHLFGNFDSVRPHDIAIIKIFDEQYTNIVNNETIWS